MTKLIRITMILVVLSFFGSSCSTQKDVVYFQDIDSTVLETADSIFQFPIVQINDILGVELSALDEASIRPFKRSSSASGDGAASINEPDEYLVHADGTIQFPIIGNIHVAGLGLQELRNILIDSLSEYIINPSVEIRIINTKITVLGSVNNPGTYTIPEETITLLQAIGLAGDFSITGRRHNVLLIRQINGIRTVKRLDFTQSDWLNSSAYYVRQNDVIYVEPNFSEVKQAGIVGDVSELLRALTVISTTAFLFRR
ncbi:polysaccharide export protein [bacterium]|nr:polysaccharide export protein [bacterium]